VLASGIRLAPFLSATFRIALTLLRSLLTYSYNIAALNFILPILSWLYWPGNTAKDLLLKELSLVGLVTGQVLLGYLADRYGRKRVGGLCLVITIFSILGFVQSSSGNENSMSVLGWLCTWRLLLSFGIGAQYPLSSVITAE
jgi:MFS transporter, PHS family, inorganic phosphate transporter